MIPTKLSHKKTKDSILCSVVSDGEKNTVYLVSGTIQNEEDSTFNIIDLTVLSGNPKSIRMDGLLFSIESGLKLFLKYKESSFIIPLEGRNKMDLGWIGGMPGHDIELLCKGTGAFFLVLDISKLK